MDTVNFRLACCKSLGCPAERFEQMVFDYCLHEHARGLGRLVFRLNPSFFEWDIQLIRAVADASDMKELEMEVSDYFYRRPVTGFVHRKLRVRVSAKRILSLANTVFKPRA